MKKRHTRIIAVLLVICAFLLAVPAGAAESGGQVVLKSSSPDANGFFSVTMTLYNMTFRVYQFALRYDTEMVAPVTSTGTAAASFEQFAAQDRSLSWLSEVGTELNTRTGLIDFAGFIMPGAEGGPLNSDSEAVIGSEGLCIYTFRFKKLKDGDAGLQIATQEKGEPYRPACPEGVIVAGRNGDVPVTVSFEAPQSLGGGSSERFEGGLPGGSTTKITADDLLKDSILLQIGNHAAVVRGSVTAVYPGEPMVTPYIKGDRTMVPVRFVASRLGAEVLWEEDTRTVEIRQNDHVLRIAIGEMSFTVDGVRKELDVPAELMRSTDGNSRTMVPIRFISEALGQTVEWDAERSIVIITDGAHGWDPDGKTEQEALKKADGLLKKYSSFIM